MIICFIGGVLVGGLFGVFIMCILSVAGDSDRDSDNTYILMKTEGKEKELKNEDEDEE